MQTTMRPFMRTYNETHPWIKFQLDLRDASYRLWLLLGEAQSKCEQIKGIPLLPSVADHLYRVFLAKGVLATTAIEGNTLTEVQVQQHLKGELNLSPSKKYLGQEIDNIIEACNVIGSRILEGSPNELHVDDIKEYNSLVLKGLSLDENVVPGQIREHEVVVGRYRGAPPEDAEYLLEQLCQWLNNDFATSEGLEGYRIVFGILKAIVVHIYIAWIHPFGDGNGRTARLVELQVLLSAGVPDTAAHLLSNHYNQTRSEYYRQLEKTEKPGGDPLSFIEYALQGYVDGLTEQIDIIKSQQLHVHWINYIHDQFKNNDRPTEVRRRRLIIDLSDNKDFVPISEVRHISTRIAEAYANKTEKTIVRDINILRGMGLVERTSEGVRARKEQMQAFMSRTLPNK